MKAVFIERTGGPDVLQFGDRPQPLTSAGEVLVKVAASGVNFTDLNLRSGINKTPLPAIIGTEGAGTVEQTTDGTGFQAGERVAWCMVRGSYAEYAAVPARMLVRLGPPVNAARSPSLLFGEYAIPTRGPKLL